MKQYDDLEGLIYSLTSLREQLIESTPINRKLLEQVDIALEKSIKQINENYNIKQN
mgnify:CR=1 FL=1